MTNREYLEQLSDELFGKDLTPENAAEKPRYLEFEHDLEEIIKKDFAKAGINTSVGMPTFLGFELWMQANVNKEMQEMFEKKYRNKNLS